MGNKVPVVNVYELSLENLHRLITYGRAVLECWTCGKPLQVGDFIFRKKNQPKQRTKLRHLECAQKVGLYP